MTDKIEELIGKIDAVRQNIVNDNACGVDSRELKEVADALAALRTQRDEVIEAKREADKWRRAATDRAYMIDALVPMLGPVAREVWDGWREKGVQRIHFSWGLEGEKLRGEEMASMIRDFQNAPCERIDNIGGDFPTLSAIRNLKSKDEPQ